MKKKVRLFEWVNEDGDDRDAWFCPTCDKLLHNPWIHYGSKYETCPVCGQELDWNYDDEM